MLLYIIAAWALLTGVLELIAAVRLRKVIQNELWLILSGVASVLFGIVLLYGAAGNPALRIMVDTLAASLMEAEPVADVIRHESHRDDRRTGATQH